MAVVMLAPVRASERLSASIWERKVSPDTEAAAGLRHLNALLGRKRPVRGMCPAMTTLARSRLGGSAIRRMPDGPAGFSNAVSGQLPYCQWSGRLAERSAFLGAIRQGGGSPKTRRIVDLLDATQRAYGLPSPRSSLSNPFWRRGLKPVPNLLSSDAAATRGHVPSSQRVRWRRSSRRRSGPPYQWCSGGAR